MLANYTKNKPQSQHKIRLIKLFVEFIYDFITKPSLKIDTVIKKSEHNQIKYYVKFVIANKRQPFVHIF
jgi:hypothetical protein